MSGRVCFVGAGPGELDLSTQRGAERIRTAEVVLHDALTDPAVRRLNPRARWIDVGKRGFCDSTGQQKIDALLVRHAGAGALPRRLRDAGWPADTPALVVSRAGWPDALASDHVVATLAEAALLHARRPTVATVGVGATAVPTHAPAGSRGLPARARAPTP